MLRGIDRGCQRGASLADPIAFGLLFSDSFKLPACGLSGFLKALAVCCDLLEALLLPLLGLEGYLDL